MREIKFRGKDLIHNNWIFGGLAEDRHDAAVILPKNNWQKGGCVDKDTIGQFTGLRDINGRDIYEGDYVKLNYKHEVASIGGVIPDQDCSCEGIVVYMESSACFGIHINKAEYPINDNIGETFPLLIFDLDGDIELL